MAAVETSVVEAPLANSDVPNSTFSGAELLLPLKTYSIANIKIQQLEIRDEQEK